jgi:hypothetical protein
MVALVIAGSVLTAAPHLWAETAAEPTKSDEDSLVRAVTAKERALDGNDPALWREAFRLFRVADSLHGTWETKYEVGFAAEQLERKDIALEAYEAALELGLAEPARSRAQRFVLEHGARFARVSVSGPAGAAVYVDGVYRGSLPLPRALVLAPGETKLEARWPGGKRLAHLELAAGDVHRIDLDQEAGPAPASGADVPLALQTRSPAPTPGTAGHAADGRSTGQPQREDDTASSTAAWWLLGAGAGVTALSALSLPLANRRLSSERSALAGSCDVLDGSDACRHARPGRSWEAQDQVDAIATWKAVRTAAWVGVGVGGALLVTGSALWLGRSGDGPSTRDASGSSRRTESWQVQIGATSLSVAGTF